MGLRQNQKLPQFEAMRRRAQQQSNVAQQEAEDALKRKFAATGMGSSGAAIKTQANLRKDFAQQAAQAREGVDIAEQAELQRRQEIQDQRDFAAQEAQKQRDFAAGESRLGREFAAGESSLSREMAADQFSKSFGLQKGAFEEQKRAARFGEKMALDQFDIDKINSAINIATILNETGDPDAFANLLDQIAAGDFGFTIDGGLNSTGQRSPALQQRDRLLGTKAFSVLSDFDAPEWQKVQARKSLRSAGFDQADIEREVRRAQKSKMRETGYYN